MVAQSYKAQVSRQRARGGSCLAFYDLAWQVMQRVVTKVPLASRGSNKNLEEHTVLELSLRPFWKM